MDTQSVLLDRAAPVAVRPARRRSGVGLAWTSFLLLILGFLVIYPVAMLVIGALSAADPVVDGIKPSEMSLANFTAVLGNENVLAALAGTRSSPAPAARSSPSSSASPSPGSSSARIRRGAASSPPSACSHSSSRPSSAASPGPSSAPQNRPAQHPSPPKPACGFHIDLYSMPGMIFVFGIYYAPYVYMFTSSALRRTWTPRSRKPPRCPGAGSAPHHAHRHLPADPPRHPRRHAAQLHRHARHLRHPRRARHAGEDPGAHHLHLHPDRLVAAALQHRRRGRRSCS